MSKVLKIFGIFFIVIFLLILIIMFLWNIYGTNDSEAITQEAISQKNVSLCDTIRSPFIGIGGGTSDLPISVCYEKYAEIYPGQQICSGFLTKFQSGDAISDNTVYTNYALCVSGEATSQRAPQICLQISDSGFKSLCVASIANKQMDRSVCNILPLDTDQKKCLDNIIFHEPF